MRFLLAVFILAQSTSFAAEAAPATEEGFFSSLGKTISNLFASPANTTGAQESNFLGMSETQVLAKLGKPEGRMEMGEETTLTFTQQEVVLKDGKVTKY